MLTFFKKEFNYRGVGQNEIYFLGINKPYILKIPNIIYILNILFRIKGI